MKLNRLEAMMKVNRIIVKKKKVIKTAMKMEMEKMIKNKTSPTTKKIDQNKIKIRKIKHNKIKINKINKLNNKNQWTIKNLM